MGYYPRDPALKGRFGASDLHQHGASRADHAGRHFAWRGSAAAIHLEEALGQDRANSVVARRGEGRCKRGHRWPLAGCALKVPLSIRTSCARPRLGCWLLVGWSLPAASRRCPIGVPGAHAGFARHAHSPRQAPFNHCLWHRRAHAPGPCLRNPSARPLALARPRPMPCAVPLSSLPKLPYRYGVQSVAEAHASLAIV